MSNGNRLIKVNILYRPSDLSFMPLQIGISFVNLTPTGNIIAALLLGATETILVGMFFVRF